MTARTYCAFLIGRLISRISLLGGFGSGITWAGEIALRIDPSIISSIRSHADSIILVIGTNGKTTTASMIEHLLTKNGKMVIHNKSGANLRNGIVGTFITQYNHRKFKTNCYAIFEVDEAEFPNIVQQLSPNIIIMLNLFRDQLDRYGEVNVVLEKWSKAIADLDKNAHLIVNADDPAVSYISENSHLPELHYFGLSRPLMNSDSTLDTWADSTYCSDCGNKLRYKHHFFSHLGDWCCTHCRRNRKKLDIEGGSISLSLSGQYNQYNAAATLLTLNVLGLSTKQDDLKDFKPAFGRQEQFRIHNRVIKIFLSKNPTGFNESIRTVLSLDNRPNLISALNDRIPDGTDVSWIWDVDFDQLVGFAKNVICTGDRVWDMALRLEYTQYKNYIVEENLKRAIEIGLQKTKEGETLYILPTYSAMLEIRKILTGRKIL